jgi:hypothetical protein
MYDRMRLRRFYEEELRGSVSFEAPELLEMTRYNEREHCDVWSYDLNEILHLTGVIDTVLEDDIFWIGSLEIGPYTFHECEYPEEWILPATLRLHDREWESIFAIIVVWGYPDYTLVIYEPQIFCDIGRECRLAYASSDTDHIWLMFMDDRTCEK